MLYPEPAEVEMTVISEACSRSLLATVSGCGGDFVDLHNLSLLSVGLSVTPAIISGLVPWYDFGIISFINAVAF